MPDSIEVTVVVPLKNEEESVANLAREVTEGMEAAGVPWECLWVNDGSTDRTLTILKELNQNDPRHAGSISTATMASRQQCRSGSGRPAARSSRRWMAMARTIRMIFRACLNG